VHPEWALIAPFFHGLQYILFVTAYKRGEMHARLRALEETQPPHEPPALQKQAKRLRNRAQEFFALAFLLGIFAFNVIPSGMDMGAKSLYAVALPTGMFVLLFAVFINVHHFFIDNVLWRRENKDVGAYLTGWRTAQAAPVRRTRSP